MREKKNCLKTVIIALGCMLFFAGCGKVQATTMRILGFAGDVTLENSGKETEIKEDLRLVSGSVLSTFDESSASVGLDDVKVVTLDQNSCAEFSQDGKKLNLDVTKGEIFFVVSEPLAEDETFEITTSTMVVGIRGTSGIVQAGDDGYDSLIITDGVVEVTGKNDSTGEEIALEVKAGEKLTIHINPETDTLEYEITEILGSDIPEFARELISADAGLFDKILESTGWENFDDTAVADADSEEMTEEENASNYQYMVVKRYGMMADGTGYVDSNTVYKMFDDRMIFYPLCYDYQGACDLYITLGLTVDEKYYNSDGSIRYESQSSSSSFDENGNPLEIIYSNGLVAHYEYEDGMPVKISIGDDEDTWETYYRDGLLYKAYSYTGIGDEYTYDENYYITNVSGVDAIFYGDNDSSEHSYDSSYHYEFDDEGKILKCFVHYVGNKDGDQSVYDYEYDLEYDQNGNLCKLTKHSTGTSEDKTTVYLFECDQYGRIIRQYDESGNLKREYEYLDEYPN